MNRNAILYSALFAMAFLYIIGRGVWLSLTIDEALSFFHLSETSIISANDHFLNSQLMRFCMAVFGESEWSLRLPNMLSFGLFGVAGFRLLKPIQEPVLFTIGSLLFFFQPFVLEFFSLARGYGLGLSFAIFALAIAMEDGKTKEWVKSLSILVLLSLAVMANAVYFNFAAGLLLWLTFSAWRSNRVLVAVYGIGLLIMGFSTFFYLYDLAAVQGLQLGTNSISDAFWRTVNKMSYWSKSRYTLHQYVVFAIFTLGLITLFWNLFKRSIQSRTLTLLVVCALMLLGWVVEHLLFKSHFPQGRMILILPVLLGLIFIYSAFDLLQKPHKWMKWPVLVMGTVAVINMAFAINFNHTVQWSSDTPVKSLVMDVKPGAVPVRVELSKRLFPVAKYYVHRLHRKIDLVPFTDNPPLTSSVIWLDIQRNSTSERTIQRSLMYREVRRFENAPVVVYERVLE